jgi:hypothetical protein
VISGDFSGCDNFAPPARFGSWGMMVRSLVNARDWGGFARIMVMDLEGAGFRVCTIFSLLKSNLAHYNLYSIIRDRQLTGRQDEV